MSREISLRHVVRQHADAPTNENTGEFYFTPAQACLMYWALWSFESELCDNIPLGKCNEEYADDLRCYADALDWVRRTRGGMVAHALRHKMGVSPC